MALVKINRAFPTVGFSRAFGPFEDLVQRFFEDELPEATRGWVPPVDVFESEDSLVFTVDVPGFDEKDLNLSVENRRLAISGERQREEKNFRRTERAYGKFERVFSLPSTVDAEKIEAKLKNGVLRISLGKREESKPRQIPVSVN